MARWLSLGGEQPTQRRISKAEVDSFGLPGWIPSPEAWFRGRVANASQVTASKWLSRMFCSLQRRMLTTLPLTSSGLHHDLRDLRTSSVDLY